MTRSSRAVLALTAIISLLVVVPLVAQSAPQAAPPAQAAPQAVWITPFRGVADVEYLNPVPKVDHKAGIVTTTIEVKNKSNGALVRLAIEEYWYDRAGTLLVGNKELCKRPLKAGETYTFTLRTAYDKRANSNMYKFSHANGTVNPKKVKKFS